MERVTSGGPSSPSVAFNWNTWQNRPEPRKAGSVRQVDGHDCGALLDAFQRVPFEAGRPTCIVAKTIKGKGVSFMENRAEWHHGVPNDAQLAAALKELGCHASD